MNLGGKGDAAELAIENDRLKTTLMILNQKMKMVEDSDDINEKWKSQVQSKEGQIKILNEQIEFLQQDQEKQRSKVKELGQTNAQQESTIQSLTSGKKMMQLNYDSLEEEHTQLKNQYNKVTT